jgi:hypothetical protein
MAFNIEQLRRIGVAVHIRSTEQCDTLNHETGYIVSPFEGVRLRYVPRSA